MHPAAADHRRDDPHLRELVHGTGHRIAVEHDEVCELAGDQLAASPLVAREPGRVDRARDQRLVDGERLLEMPACPPVQGALDAGAEPEEGSSSSIGASEPLATSAPDFQSEP